MRPILFSSSSLPRWTLVAGLLSFIFATVAARGNDAKDSRGRWDFGALAKVPQKARQKPNPLAHDPQAARAGGILYEQHCAECHGANAEGSEKAPDLHAWQVREAPTGSLFWIVSNGVVRRGMPGWSRLPPPERWQIVTYLKSLPASPNLEHGKTRSLHGPPQ